MKDKIARKRQKARNRGNREKDGTIVPPPVNMKEHDFEGEEES